MKDKRLLVAGGVLLVALLVYLVGNNGVSVKLRGLGDEIPPTKAQTVTTSTVFISGSTSTQIAEANTQAQVRRIVNTTGQDVALWFSSTSTNFTSAVGIPLYATSTTGSPGVLVLSGDTLWTGKIYAVLYATGTKTMTVIEQ